MLAWLLGEPSGEIARAALATAEAVTTSDLTLIECDRALIRGVATGDVTPAEAARLRRVLNHAAARWNLVPIGAEVVERARRAFPAEPLRALDAIHLASALLTVAEVPELTVLSFDRRIRKAAQELGLTRTPA